MSAAELARMDVADREGSALLKFLGLRKAHITIVVAHPDDETLGIGGHLAEFDKVVIVHATDGAPRDMSDARRLGFNTREAYALARRAELVAATSEAGTSGLTLLNLGVVDQDAATQLAPLSKTIAALLDRHGPAAVFTHAYEGGHPDHDAVAFATHVAIRLMRGVAPPPVIIEMPFYRADQGRIAAQSFAPASDSSAVCLALSPDAQRCKQRMLERFRTQRETLMQFPVVVERFRRAPMYDFTRLPNDGELYYERFPWGWDGSRWLGCVRAALLELRLSP
jgi:LmbE family N-acetylglucosaminyl deacetylase